MRDELRFAAPLGPLGTLAETLFLRRYFVRFLEERNRVLRETAEAPAEVWSVFLERARLPQ